MGYAAINATTQAVKDQVRVGLVKQAGIRSGIVKNGAADLDQRELAVCKAVINGTMPDAWVTIVLIELDIAGQIAAPTDTQIDTVITTGLVSPPVASAWSFLIASR